jgi:hypothetical protein
VLWNAREDQILRVMTTPVAERVAA